MIYTLNDSTMFREDLTAGLTQVLDDGTNTYLYGVSRIAQQTPNGVQYFLGDVLGSVRQLTNAAGEVILAQGYAPYGEVQNSTGGGDSSYGFTGEWTDSTGLIFLRARYYAPGVGRFISRDMWPQKHYPHPLSANLWLYALANPVNLADPSGQDPWWCEQATDPEQCYQDNTPGWQTYERFDKTLPYIYSEMLNNAQSGTVRLIKTFLEFSCNPYIPNNSSVVYALSIWIYMVRKGGPWDHKPMLERMLDLDGDPSIMEDNDYYFPIRGDTKHEYYYDIWSNIHYGYVGRAATFDAQTLQWGAGAGDWFGGVNDPGDVLSVQIGIDLWEDHQLGLLAEHIHRAILAHTQDYLARPDKKGNKKVIDWWNGQ